MTYCKYPISKAVSAHRSAGARGVAQAVAVWTTGRLALLMACIAAQTAAAQSVRPGLGGAWGGSPGRMDVYVGESTAGPAGGGASAGPAISASGGAPAPRAHVAPAAPAVSRTPHPAVVRVVVPEQGATSYGSGTLIDVRDEYGLVLTNWHVVRDGSGVAEVQFPDGFRSPATVLKVDSDWDLAALVIWRPSAEPVPLAAAPPRPGDVLSIAGYGQGDFRQVTGRCTQYVAPGMNLPYEMVEVNVQARHGDSGGPIFNQRGELAGVLFGAGEGTTSGSYCGRVGMFLASISPDLADPRRQKQLAANRPPRSGPTQPSEPGPQTLAGANARDRGDASAQWTGTSGAGSPPARLPAVGAIAGQGPRRVGPATPSGNLSSGGVAAETPATAALSSRPKPLEPVAAVASGPPSAPAPVAAVGGVAAGAAPEYAAPTAPDGARRGEMTWGDMAGDTWLGQAKTILAIIGVLAIFAHGLKLAAG